ncbi:sulfite exporter TauE/SafE family protein [Pseudonocardia sp. H11422]|uniref:sulfite exporter TauE/SafE family protein n=1 Tax=Pseudonocardia sp. H11422 TaxID=2835866 RepID=UPI001BDCD37C|nr:sulfite exporter TauE/SafE family protein [Pseudonocardia sp. H11422]
MLWAAGGLGLIIGLVMGGLGGGGGVLTVPVLVYLLGQDARDATTSSVIIVGIAAAIGAVARIRGGLVRWRTGLGFGLVGVPAAFLGTLLNQSVDQQILLLSFAALTLLAAIAMLINSRGGPHGEASEGDCGDEELASGAPTGSGSAAATGMRAPAATRQRRRIALAAKGAFFGVLVGFLTGFLGVGGGFLIVPVLVIAMRIPMTCAIGTSLLIIAINSVASLVSRAGFAEFDWQVIVPFTAAAIVGTLAGQRISDRFSGTVLTRTFAVMLILVAGFVAVESLGSW